MMTISQFSEMTGLRPKLLRYYEETGLILPAERSSNGYRLYNESQVEVAQLVNSLRQAGVSMTAIREFLEASEERKKQLLEEWRSMAEAKLLSVQVANQFLQGFDIQTKRMHLVHWESQKTIVWLTLEMEGNLHSTINSITKSLVAAKKVTEKCAYIRFTQSENGRVKTEVGLCYEDLEIIPEDAEIQIIPQTLFATMVFKWTMPYSCKPLISMINRFGFQQVGEPFRKVIPSMEEYYTLMIPVATPKI